MYNGPLPTSINPTDNGAASRKFAYIVYFFVHVATRAAPSLTCALISQWEVTEVLFRPRANNTIVFNDVPEPVPTIVHGNIVRRVRNCHVFYARKTEKQTFCPSVYTPKVDLKIGHGQPKSGFYTISKVLLGRVLIFFTSPPGSQGSKLGSPEQLSLDFVHRASTISSPEYCTPATANPSWHPIVSKWLKTVFMLPEGPWEVYQCLIMAIPNFNYVCERLWIMCINNVY